MADGQVFTSRKSGALWILLGGPNTKPQYLPCHDLEDVSESRGSSTLIQCINENGEYVALDTTLEAPELISFQLGTFVGKAADFLENARCPFPLIVHLRSCGKADNFDNYERSFIIETQRVTGVTLSGLVRKDEDVPAMHTFDVEAFPRILRVFRLTPLSESVTSTADINSVVYLDDPSCWDSCDESVGPCDYGYAAESALSGSPSDTAFVLKKTPTSGGWTPIGTAPFGAGENISSIAVFRVGQGNRILVTRGTTDVGNPAEVAYSDDEGVTWTNVNVGSVNGQTFGSKSLAVLNRYSIFAVASGGYIYKSEDGGASWTAQESGVITSSDYLVIKALNDNVLYAGADDGTVVRTVNGGVTWGATGSAPDTNGITAIDVLATNRLWAADDAGVLYYSYDGGTVWTSKSFGGGAGAVNDLEFVNNYVGYLIQDVAGVGSVYRTINGGYSWELQRSMPTNTGFNDLYACDMNTVTLAGNAGQIVTLQNV